MKSEGVGKMLLYTASGASMPGFDHVFASQAAAKLASIGDICDADMVCVFDKRGLKTYKADDVKIVGKVFTQDERDPKSRLYPLTLFRKSGERVDKSEVIAALLFE